MEKPSIETTCNHIVMASLSQVLVESIWELQENDPWWSNKMRNILPKIEKGLHEKVTPLLKEDTEGGKALQKEILQCTTEITKGLEEYKKYLIEEYGKANT